MVLFPAEPCRWRTDHLGDVEETAEHMDAFFAGSLKDTGMDGASAAVRAIHRENGRTYCCGTESSEGCEDNCFCSCENDCVTPYVLRHASLP